LTRIPTVNILGVPMHCVTMDEAVASVADFIAADSFHLVITLGVEMVMNAQRDARFLAVARKASLLTPDTIGVVWAARRKGHKVNRVAGIEMLEHLAERGAREGWRFFLLGGKPGIAEEASQALVKRYPGLVVAGTSDGYFKEDAEVILKIRAARADVLLAAMGSPRQETWTFDNGDALGVKVAIGVGGSFDVLAGRSVRAPALMRRFGLEWLYRLYREPSRVGRMLALPHFALKILLSG